MPPAIGLPLESIFHTAAVSAAAPLPAASAWSAALTVQVPAGNVKPAEESTVQPLHVGGIDGRPVTAEFPAEVPKLVPETNAM